MPSTLPPVKVNRTQRRSALQAAKGGVIGNGKSYFTNDELITAGVGFDVSFALCRAPWDAPAREDSQTSTRLFCHLWRRPCTNNGAAPATLDVSVPAADFRPIAVAHVPDCQTLLVAGSDGRAAVISYRVLAGVSRLDGEPVTVDATVQSISEDLDTPIVAAASDGNLFVASQGSTRVFSATLASDGELLVSVQAIPSAGSGRTSGSARWFPSLSLSGLFGRGSGQSEHRPSARGDSDDGIVAMFGSGGRCVVETTSTVSVLPLHEDDTVRWRLSKESCEGRALAAVVDVALSRSEVWLLALPVGSKEAAVVSAPLSDASRLSGLSDLSLPLQSSVVAGRGARHWVSGSPKVQIVDEANCVVISRDRMTHCCIASSIRESTSEIIEPHPSGVFVHAGVLNENGRYDLVTNYGPLSRWSSKPGEEDLDVSAATTAGVADDSVWVNAATPGRGAAADQRLSSSRSMAMHVDASSGRAGMFDGVNVTPAPSALDASRATAVRRAPRSATNFDNVVAEEASKGLDNAWCLASDDIALRLAVNPSNWSKGDLGREDSDGITFLTKELERRAERHGDIVEALSRDGKWARLESSTQASIVSRNEALAVLRGLRHCHNNSRPGRDAVRLSLFADTIVRVAQHLHTPQTTAEASAAEIVFCSTDSVPTLLHGVTHVALQTSESATTPLREKLAVACAAVQLFDSALDALTSSRAEHKDAGHLTAAAQPMLWTSNHGQSMTFLSALHGYAAMCADVLVLVVDAAVLSGEDRAMAIEVLGGIDRAFRAASQLCACTDDGAVALVGRTLLRDPFVVSALGYPHGAPMPSKSEIAASATQVVRKYATDMGICPILWTFVGATCVANAGRLSSDDVTVADVPEWNGIRECCQQVPGFFQYMMGQLVATYREQELRLVPRLVPSAYDGRVESLWSAFLRTHAPSSQWVCDSSTDSLIALSKATERPEFMMGDGVAEHREIALELARLANFAEGEPQGPRQRLWQEKTVANAQAKHLAAHATSALEVEQVVRLLLELDPTANADAWVDAVKLINACPKDQMHRLSLTVLVKCFELDYQEVLSIAHNDTVGDGARRQMIDETITGRCVLQSPHLRRMLSQENDEAASATSTDFIGALRAWSATHFGAVASQ